MPRKTHNTSLDTTLYCYVEKANADHAKSAGKKLFGSFSSYINVLIAKDRGVEPSPGSWQSELDKIENPKPIKKYVRKKRKKKPGKKMTELGRTKFISDTKSEVGAFVKTMVKKLEELPKLPEPTMFSGDGFEDDEEIYE